MGGGHRAVVGGEADEERGIAESLADELPDVQLAFVAHLGRSRVSEMGVVRPHHHAGIGTEEGEQALQRLGHVAVAEVPGCDARSEHRPVVGLGVAGEPGVLRGGEGVLAVRRRPLLQLGEHLDDTLLAVPDPEPRRVPIRLRIPVMVEARVACAGAFRRRGIVAIEVVDDRADRRIQAVEVHPVDGGALVRRRLAVAGAQPADELHHGGVAPHPGGEARETVERLLGAIRSHTVPYVLAHPVRVGPVGLPDDRPESQLVDEALGDARALPIHLVASVGRLAEQYHPRVARHLDEQVMVVARSAEERRGMPYRGDDVPLARHRSESSHAAGASACHAGRRRSYRVAPSG